MITWCVAQKTTFSLEGFRDMEMCEPIEEDKYKEQIKDNMKNAPFELRPYQDEAVRAALKYHRGILLSCTSSGKSLMLYNIIRCIRKQNFKKILLVVPNIMLVDQMYDDFKDYGYENMDDEVERLGGGHEAYFDKPVLISTWQSLQNKETDFFENFDGVFIDEVHSSKAEVLGKIIKSCTNARFKIGTTGTLPTDKSELLKIKSVIGDVIFELKSKELIDVGVLTKIKIANIIAKYPAEFVAQNKGRSYPEEVRMVEEYADRNVQWIPHTEMPEYYRKIDLCLITSTHEGTPLPALEAMSCGIPLISTDVGVINELFGEKQRKFIIGSRDYGKNDEQNASCYHQKSCYQKYNTKNGCDFCAFHIYTSNLTLFSFQSNSVVSISNVRLK